MVDHDLENDYVEYTETPLPVINYQVLLGQEIL